MSTVVPGRSKDVSILALDSSSLIKPHCSYSSGRIDGDIPSKEVESYRAGPMPTVLSSHSIHPYRKAIIDNYLRLNAPKEVKSQENNTIDRATKPAR